VPFLVVKSEKTTSKVGSYNIQLKRGCKLTINVELMFRTEQSVGMLKSIAMIAGLAILLWSLGLPSLRFIEAANVTTISDTISDSAPSANADHTIDFVTPTGVPNGQDIVVTFPASFDLSGIGAEDIDLYVNDSNFLAANWSVATTATAITITIDTGSIAAAASTSIRIGDVATEVTSDSQIGNPSAEGTYEINVAAGTADSGATRVVVLTAVTVSAAVDTIFNFTVAGVATGTVNGEAITGPTGSTTIPFGKLSDGAASTTAQQLTVSTNASNGYVVTMQIDTPFQSSTGADIDGFIEGSDTDNPAAWASPVDVLGLENTYGHWGVTSDDYATFARGADEFAGTDEWIAATTTARAIMGHNGPSNGIGVGVGTTTVGYKVEISALQEAGDDYETTLTYVATPTF